MTENPQAPAKTPTPPASPTSKPSPTETNTNDQTKKPTSIDLWNVPSLVQPSPPSNTLLITNLQSSHIFTAAALQHLYNLLNTPVALNSFAPLPSLRRIIISYPTTEAAVATRQLLEQSSSLPTPPSTESPNPGTNTTNTSNGQNPEFKEDQQGPKQQQQQQQQPLNPPIPGNGDIRPMKIYFGEPTPLVGQYASDSADPHLQAPSLGKLMFISPPPSPPCGWEIRDEEPPNKATHAEDLLAALAGLNNNNNNNDNQSHTDQEESSSRTKKDNLQNFHGLEGGGDWSHNHQDHHQPPFINASRRTRRGTLTVYHPRDHGDSEDLPAVMVEDMTGEEEPTAPEETAALPTRTSRPPVELMNVA